MLSEATRKAGAGCFHGIVHVKAIALHWFSTKIPKSNCLYGNNSEMLVFQLALGKGRNQLFVSRVGRKSFSVLETALHSSCYYCDCCPGYIQSRKWKDRVSGCTPHHCPPINPSLLSNTEDPARMYIPPLTGEEDNTPEPVKNE